jgi:hypothetical protein
VVALAAADCATAGEDAWVAASLGADVGDVAASSSASLGSVPVLDADWVSAGELPSAGAAEALCAGAGSCALAAGEAPEAGEASELTSAGAAEPFSVALGDALAPLDSVMVLPLVVTVSSRVVVVPSVVVVDSFVVLEVTTGVADAVSLELLAADGVCEDDSPGALRTGCGGGEEETAEGETVTVAPEGGSEAGVGARLTSMGASARALVRALIAADPGRLVGATETGLGANE